MHRVEGLVGLLEADPSPRGSTELKKEIENFIYKSNDVTAGLQYLILHENSEEGKERYEREMQTLGEEDTNIVTHARRTMLRGPEPRAALNAGPGGNNSEAAPSAHGSTKGFKVFYAFAMLQHGPIEEQQVNLHICLDIRLETSLGSKIDP